MHGRGSAAGCVPPNSVTAAVQCAAGDNKDGHQAMNVVGCPGVSPVVADHVRVVQPSQLLKEGGLRDWQEQQPQVWPQHDAKRDRRPARKERRQQGRWGAQVQHLQPAGEVHVQAFHRHSVAGCTAGDCSLQVAIQLAQLGSLQAEHCNGSPVNQEDRARGQWLDARRQHCTGRKWLFVTDPINLKFHAPDRIRAD